MLLYANEIYTQYLNNNDTTSGGIEADLLVTTPTETLWNNMKLKKT